MDSWAVAAGIWAVVLYQQKAQKATWQPWRAPPSAADQRNWGTEGGKGRKEGGGGGGFSRRRVAGAAAPPFRRGRSATARGAGRRGRCRRRAGCRLRRGAPAGRGRAPPGQAHGAAERVLGAAAPAPPRHRGRVRGAPGGPRRRRALVQPYHPGPRPPPRPRRRRRRRVPAPCHAPPRSVRVPQLPLPDPSIRTAAVAVADDDMLPDAAALSFAFAAWQQAASARRGSPLVGFFPRSHHLDLARGRWEYTAADPGRYSMVLTKFMVLGAELLHRYSCSPELAAARAVVDRERNCEDILMNFVAAEEAGAGPVLVEAGSVRDWGDPRNDANAGAAGDEEGGAMRDVGLSSTGGTAHWEKRGECITEFHRLLGRMPLRYSHGKVVEAAVGEQGLCSKGGRLVRCDQE
ncbi:hypothetical protein ACP70R_017782 [Stipagrostis hirtigluma subsp. patula]